MKSFNNFTAVCSAIAVTGVAAVAADEYFDAIVKY